MLLNEKSNTRHSTPKNESWNKLATVPNLKMKSVTNLKHFNLFAPSRAKSKELWKRKIL